LDEGLEAELDIEEDAAIRIRSDGQAMTAATLILLDHHNSYDKAYRPTFVRGLAPRITHPLQQLNNHSISTHTRFDAGDLTRVLAALTLLPRVIVDAGQQRHSLELAVYIMLRRWHAAMGWQEMSNCMGISRPELINCYSATIRAFEVYHLVVQVLDFVRIRPLQQEWSDTLEFYGAASQTYWGLLTARRSSSPGQGRESMLRRCWPIFATQFIKGSV
jgi:hypothetical protein